MFFTLVLLATMVVSAHSWWCTGHMLVAAIAQKNVKLETKARINPIMQYMLNINGGDAFDSTSNFHEAACWADDIKADGMFILEDWHFINSHYDVWGDQSSSLPPVEQLNAIKAILSCLNVLKKGGQEPKKHAWSLGFALYYLIHSTGDIHQPLHTIERFTSQFKNGDLGGNFVKVKVRGAETNLHKVWDSIGYTDPEFSRPLTAEETETFAKMANEIVLENENKVEKERLAFKYPKQWVSEWAHESYALAVNSTYPDVPSTPYSNLSETYLERVANVSRSQIYVAGIRLAKLLDYALTGEGELIR